MAVNEKMSLLAFCVSKQGATKAQNPSNMDALGENYVWSGFNIVMEMEGGAVMAVVGPKRLWLWPLWIENGEDVGDPSSAVIVKLIYSANRQKREVQHFHIDRREKEGLSS
jgi:hypothetical protein